MAIFTEDTLKEIRDLDATQSRDALTAMINCLESPVPQSVIEKPYETCEELEQLRQGDLRIYVKLITDIPVYDVLWVFAIKKHRYRNLGKFDAEACQKVADMKVLTDVVEVDRYLSRNEVLTVEDLRDLRSEL